MLSRADRDIQEVVRFFTARSLDSGFLVPTETALEKSIMDAHIQLSDYLRRTGVHDFRHQLKGSESKVIIKTWIVKEDSLIETKSSLYRPETKSGDPRIWIYNLAKHADAGNLLAILIYEGEIFVINTSKIGLLESACNASSPFSRLLDLLAGAKNKPLDDKFSEWNLRLLRSFFSEASQGEEVFIRVDKDFLDQIGQDIGGDAGFLKAIQTGPSWMNPNFSFVKHIHELVKQRKLSSRNYKDPGDFDLTYRGHQAPAYLPYLAALVRNDSENVSAYYAGLQNDLNLNHAFGPSEMQQVEIAWDDLQKWTQKNEASFGYFKLRRLGGYRLIGVPRSQSILKPKDIEVLGSIFVQAQVKPGQELSEDYLKRILDEARATKSIFSAGFQKALDISAFEQPIRAVILSAYADWDGTLPAKRSITGDTSNQSTLYKFNVGISLAVVNEEPLHVTPLWHLPAILDDGEFEIAFQENNWKGLFAGTEGANTIPCKSRESEFWKIIEHASIDSLNLELQYHGNDESETKKLQLTLSEHPLWIMTPSFDVLTGGVELREGDLPGSGPAFLLASPHTASSLIAYLAREKPEHEVISAKGIPEDWIFCYLVECSLLTPEQRLLPDGQDSAHPKPRAIRFVGGRSIRRGYSRMYLSYDLPAIELDAPEGTRLLCPNDLVIEEKEWAPDSVRVQNLLRPLRRFEIKHSKARSASYDLRAIAQDGTLAGKAKLKVASLGGEFVEIGNSFSIDNLGNPIASEDGLSGALLPEMYDLNTEQSVNLIGFDLQLSELGSPVNHDSFKLGVHELFLDALAQSGAMNYGSARDLLQRLIQSKGVRANPAFILLELRKHGHLEISTTQKGHLARIYPVKPTLYLLPSRCINRQIWALAGTLRIDHWLAIASETIAWTALQVNDPSIYFKSWRLLISDELKAKQVCNEIDFEFTKMPCISIANWAASLETFSEQTFHNTMESIGVAKESAQRLNASKGLFTANPCGNTCELWKVEDLDTGMDNLYVIADKGRYAFVRDSRWGIWLALDAFAKWVSVKYGFGGVYPVPIMYEVKNGSLWLPARVGLPTVLERALVLCSGSSPEVLSLKKQDPEGYDHRILLSDVAGNATVLSVNPFYSDMAEGRWLAYRLVPEYIAKLFADKLGTVLDFI